jgi:hypothetical protein
MTPAKYNMVIWRGAVKDIEVRIRANLSNCTAFLYYRDLNNITQSISLSLTNSTDSAGVMYTLKAQISQQLTRAMPLGRQLPYEIQIRTADNKDYVYVYGNLIIQGGVNLD